MNGKKYAAAYIRVSTDDQVEYSPDTQLKCIAEFARKNGYILPDELVFRDDGISGRSAKKRPAFNRMIAESKRKPTPFNAVLVWKFSRFARNQEESIFYKSMLKKNKIEVISISEPVTDGPFGDLIERIIEWSDEYYSIRLSGEVKRGMNEKASRGEAVTIAPYGYKMEDKKYVADEKEAEIVRYIFDEFANGASYRDIAMRLNAMGAKTHRLNPFEGRTVEYIVNNPVYIGKIRWSLNGADSCGIHTPIVTNVQWERAQSEAARIKNMYKPRAKKEVNGNVLQGIMRCSSCGGTLIKTGEYLQCGKYTKGACMVSHSIPYKTAVQTVIEHIGAEFDTGGFELKKQKSCENEEKYLADLIKKEQKKLDLVKKAYENEIDTLEEYKQNKARILKTVESLKIKLDGAEKRIKNAENGNKRYENLTAVMCDEKIPDGMKNKILRSFVDKIVYDKHEKSLDFYYYF